MKRGKKTMGKRGKQAGWKSVTLTEEANQALATISTLTASTLMGAQINLDGLISALLVKEAERMSRQQPTG
jgi:hypothetical protein